MDEIPLETMRVAFIPDVHAPYHHVKDFNLAVKAVRLWKPDVMVVMGDFLDMDSVSSYPKVRGRRLTLKEEMDAALPVFQQLDDLKAPTNIFLEGNHEYRFDRYIREHAGQLDGLIDVQHLLKMDQRPRWRWVPYGEAYRLGELMMTHDIGRAGATVARQQRLDSGENIVCGHSHRLQVDYGGMAHGPVHVSASLGWLGDPEAITYRHRATVQRDWTRGFATAIFHANTSGLFHLRIHPIVKGTVELDGRIIS